MRVTSRRAVMYVCRPNIEENRKDGGHRPALVVEANGTRFRTDFVEFVGVTGVLQYDPQNPVAGGVTAWFEASGTLLIKDPIMEDMEPSS